MDELTSQQQSTDHEEWFRYAVQKGIDSANAGRLIDNDTVETMFAARRAGSGKPRTDPLEKLCAGRKR